MKAVVNFATTPDSVELRDVPLPSIENRDALIEVRSVGVCGSDIHQWKGSQSWKVNHPVILGHEFSGVVAEVGRDVQAIRPGDRVVSETAAVIDETSPLSRRGDYHLDPKRLGFGYGVDGAMTRFVRVPERCLHAIPDSLPFDIAALTEPCSVAYNALCASPTMRPGDTVAVIGPGPIGLLCLALAQLQGASETLVIGTESDRDRLAAAKRLGATRCVSAAEQANEAAFAMGDGLGLDLVIDAAGASQALQTALQIVRPGGQIVKVGWGPQPLGFSLDPLVQKAVTLRGSFSHNWPVWEKVIALLASGRLQLGEILQMSAPLHRWQDVFQQMLDKKIVKAVLHPGS